MFELIAERSEFYRVKRGQGAEEVQSHFLSPCAGGAFAGEIVCLAEKIYRYTVKPLESYRSIAEKVGADEEKLRKINDGKILYPTLTIFVPQ